ncbi:hypothetical protein FQZ97_776620 [compost metagenome]
MARNSSARDSLVSSGFSALSLLDSSPVAGSGSLNSSSMSLRSKDSSSAVGGLAVGVPWSCPLLLCTDGDEGSSKSNAGSTSLSSNVGCSAEATTGFAVGAGDDKGTGSEGKSRSKSIGREARSLTSLGALVSASVCARSSRLDIWASTRAGICSAADADGSSSPMSRSRSRPRSASASAPRGAPGVVCCESVLLPKGIVLLALHATTAPGLAAGLPPGWYSGLFGSSSLPSPQACSHSAPCPWVRP